MVFEGFGTVAGGSSHYDFLFAGGGLASGLTAYRLRQLFPDARIAIAAAGQRLGGNHTWSFHTTDASLEQLEWMAPFISYEWAAQSVAFPKRRRTLPTGYRSVTAERFAEVLSRQSGIDIITGQPVMSATPDALVLRNNQSLHGQIVFDGRGPMATPDMSLGFQKFLGLEIEFEEPHGLEAPIIMDATVPQTDGYRFVYVLPFTETTALIEDTYYADGYQLPREALRDEIMAYAARKGWRVKSVLREEDGILPIVLDGDIDAYWQRLEGAPAPIGLRAGLFHPITGYSMAEAIALADHIANAIAQTPKVQTADMSRVIEAHAKSRWKQHSFYRMLNRMLFRAAEPQQRYIVLQRFYGLPIPLINRFYAGQNNWADRFRILAGKPPVPIGAAIKALPANKTGQMVEEGLLG